MWKKVVSVENEVNSWKLEASVGKLPGKLHSWPVKPWEEQWQHVVNRGNILASVGKLPGKLHSYPVEPWAGQGVQPDSSP